LKFIAYSATGDQELKPSTPDGHLDGGDFWLNMHEPVAIWSENRIATEVRDAMHDIPNEYVVEDEEPGFVRHDDPDRHHYYAHDGLR
jgi:hypothetical protein